MTEENEEEETLLSLPCPHEGRAGSLNHPVVDQQSSWEAGASGRVSCSPRSFRLSLPFRSSQALALLGEKSPAGKAGHSRPHL